MLMEFIKMIKCFKGSPLTYTLTLLRGGLLQTSQQLTVPNY